VSTAENFMTPGAGAAHRELERRYRLVLRLYPREFRARQESEMLGVLMAGEPGGQRRPARADVADIARGALIVRLRGPRDGWLSALAMFSLLAPLFLVVTDILQVAIPYRVSASAFGEELVLRQEPGQIGGVHLLSQHVFFVLAGSHAVILALVLARLRLAALAALAVAAVYNVMALGSFGWALGMTYSIEVVAITVLLLEAIALATLAARRAGHRPARWRPAVPVLLLATSIQAGALMLDGNDLSPLVRTGPSVTAYLVIAITVAVTGLAVTMALGLGWRTCLLLAAMCYPPLLYVVVNYAAFGFRSEGTYDAVKALLDFSTPQLATLHLTVLLAPPLLVAWWAAVRAARTRPTSGQSTVAPDDPGLT
jgi:hypothetical protein